MTLASLVASSIVPSDPTSAIAAVAIVALLAFVGFMAFLALAPVVSSSWASRLGGTASAGSSIEANEAD
ncbi:hypothetical protein [Natrialba sp. INN-245]|uniref:hypothetical protein n=1 Tax=Natrialba sp. INN-245 TaxID=2690967 RepID=UPI0013135FDE|nr:hypothetical protein [Natrialba sp. INN-245]MWV41506.1 hypothetical protein [Natrialba sp. INN-245]